MLSDPITLAGPATTDVLNRISTGVMSSTYLSADRTYTLEIRHSYVGKKKARIRTNVKLTQTKIAADPLLTDTNNEYSQSINFTIDRPLAGFSVSEVIELARTLYETLDASTHATLDDVVELQS
jgi:hypothetical protein